MKNKEKTDELLQTKAYNHRDSVLSAQDFERLIHRERSRTDRTGSEFSLVLYTLCEEADGETLPAEFVRALRRRIRSVDEIGRLQDGTVGVLLPSTGFLGARAFASGFAASPLGAETCASFHVYTYPSNWERKGIRQHEEQGSNGSRPLPGRQRDRAAGGELLDKMVEAMLFGRIPAWKRALDLVVASAAVLLLSPLLLLLSLFIKVVSPGPVFFRQTRVGFKGRHFTLLKFRTMHPNIDVSSHRDHLKKLIHSGQPMTKLDARNDPRIIPGARILRRACLDELPQLFNVIRGEMSLVGPRPCLPYEVEEYLRWHAHRFDVLPGITGLWQVSGKDNLSFQQMMRLDIAYSHSLSLFRDLGILLKTIPVVAGFVLESIARRIGGSGPAPGSVGQAQEGI